MLQAVFLTIQLTHLIFGVVLASFALLVILGTGQVISVDEPWCCNQFLGDWLKILDTTKHCSTTNGETYWHVLLVVCLLTSPLLISGYPQLNDHDHTNTCEADT